MSGGIRSSEPVVLVVEDDDELRPMYSEWLSADCRVRVAADAATAVERFDQFVDVVLLDRELPDGDGHQVLTDLRTHHGECRVAMVTAVEPDYDLLEMDFDAYVTKPVRESDLRELVESLCSYEEIDLAQEGEIII